MELNETEKVILQAAKKVFVLKGMDGARMQEIADEAGINKAMLHYYFRSKEKLFQSVFKHTAEGIFPIIRGIIEEDCSFEEKIKKFIDVYTDFLLDNPYVPHFIINEIHRNPEEILPVFGEKADSIPIGFFMQVNTLYEKGEIKDIDPRHLLISLISLVVFPFGGKPLLKNLLAFKNDDEYYDFVIERKKIVFDMIMSSIKK